MLYTKYNPMKEEKKFQVNLKRGDLDNLNKEEYAEVATALLAFGNTKGFSLFFDYLRNRFISDTLYENRTNITSEYVLGSLDMLDSIEDLIKSTKEFDKSTQIIKKDK